MNEHEPTDGGDSGGPDGAASLSPEALYERLANGDPLTILDTRDRDEFEAWHVDGPGVRAVQVPHAKFVQAEVTGGVEDLVPEEAGLDPGDEGGRSPVVAVCARGEASDHAAGLLREAGVDAVNLAGGMEAWAEVYVANELDVAEEGPDSGGLAVRQYVRPSSGCLAYLVYDGAGDGDGAGEAVLVDPLRAFADRYVEDARELGVEIVAAVDTHVHADHLSGLREVAERTGAATYLPEGATDRGLAFDADLLGDGDEIPVGDATVRALHVPGHTTEMTALRVENAGAGDVLLTGDSLFVESVARPDLEAGAEGARELAERLHESLHERILDLPEETVVAPGHVGPRTGPTEDGTYTARLGDLRERLDLLGLDREAFVQRVLDSMPPQPANYETIIEVNLGRESIDEEEGFELELGPNNCAVSA